MIFIIDASETQGEVDARCYKLSNGPQRLGLGDRRTCGIKPESADPHADQLHLVNEDECDNGGDEPGEFQENATNPVIKNGEPTIHLLEQR